MQVFILLAVTVLAFSPALYGGFVWDDDVHLTANPTIVGPLGFKEIWTTGAAVYYPLTLTSFWIQYQFWGLSPLPYHLVNIVMHAGAALLLWRVLLQLNVRGAWLGAVLWAVHPVQVESVAWITELKNTQSAVFYLIAISFFMGWLSDEREQRGMEWSYVLALLGAVLAILSKTSTVMLPFVLALCWWWKEGRWRFRNLLWLAPFLALSITAGVWTIWEQQHQSGALGPEWSQTWPDRLVVAGRIPWFYLGKLLWPNPLIFIYPRWNLDSSQAMAYLPAIGILIALLFLWKKRNGWLRPVFFGSACFLVSLFPVSGVFNVYFFRYSFVADHFQYLAAMGPLSLAMAGLAAAFDVRKQRGWLPLVVCAAVLLTCGALSRRQSAVYADSVTLWRDTLQKNPQAWMAHTNLGAELDDQGRFDEAIAEYESALRINPDDSGAHNNLATHLARLGKLPEAIHEWEEALRIQPNHAEAHGNLAYALAQSERLPDAFKHWERALQIKPDAASIHFDYGVGLAQAGRDDDALRHFGHALQLTPNNADAHYRIGLVLGRQGKVAPAIDHYRKALELDPASRSAQYALAWLLATTSEARLRNGKEALELAQRLARSSAGSSPQILDLLAAAYAESGEFDRAIETARDALNLVATQDSRLLVRGIEDRLRLYRAHQPYYEQRGNR